MLVSAGYIGSLPLPGCFWENSEHTPDCPLALLSVVKFLSRGDDLHFDVQPKCLGDLSSLVVGYSATPQV